MTGYEMFEKIAEAYLNANEEQRKVALDLIPEGQRMSFLEGVGLYHLLTDEAFFKAACNATCETVCNECGHSRTVAERLKEARLAAGMTQGQLAKQTGLAQTAIANYESGLRIPRDQIKAKLANELKVSILDLFF